MTVRQRATQSPEEDDGTRVVRTSTESIDDTSCSSYAITKYLAIIVLVTYITIPTLLFVFPQIIEQIVFLNLVVGSAERATLDQPTASWNLPGAVNFRLPCDDVELGVWHVLPSNKASNYKQNSLATEEEIAAQLEHADSIVIYHHGNGMSRATGGNGQRLALYNRLRLEGYHVIAFDYRGFGDSTGWPSESGVVNDSVAVYNWVKGKANPDTKIVLWGHSLGSAVSTLAAKKIFEQCRSGYAHAKCPGPDGLILEGPFTNVRQGAGDSAVAWLFSFIYPKSLLEWVVETGLVKNDLFLASDENIGEIKCPVLILHADDDGIIPSRHSEQLYQACERSSTHGKMRAKLVKFKAGHGYGHMDIYKTPELPNILKRFLDNEQESNFETTVL